MKLNLIKKDFLLTRYKVFAYMLLCLAIALIAKITIHHELAENIVIAALGGLFSYFVTIIEFEVEGKYKAEAGVVTLPYTRREIVVSKYACVILGSTLYYFLNCIEMAILVLIKHGTFSMHGILYGICISIIVQGCMIPFFMKFDYLKAANIMMLGIMLWSVLFVIFTKKMADFVGIMNSLLAIDIKLIMLIALIIMLLSYLISTTLYEKKELS
jgi:hypothetical protein